MELGAPGALKWVAGQIGRNLRVYKSANPGGRFPLFPRFVEVVIRRHPYADVGDQAVPAHEALIGQFGLVPHWADDLKLGRHTFNARSETAATKPSFRDAWHQARKSPSNLSKSMGHFAPLQ